MGIYMIRGLRGFGILVGSDVSHSNVSVSLYFKAEVRNKWVKSIVKRHRIKHKTILLKNQNLKAKKPQFRCC